ncbi:hypothetical protein GN956_G939 [Arapaima gigas]
MADPLLACPQAASRSRVRSAPATCRRTNCSARLATQPSDADINPHNAVQVQHADVNCEIVRFACRKRYKHCDRRPSPLAAAAKRCSGKDRVCTIFLTSREPLWDLGCAWLRWLSSGRVPVRAASLVVGFSVL